MDNFISKDDESGRLINAKAIELYIKLQRLDVDGLGMPEYCLAYLKSSHTKRLFFSIETSAHLLYRSLQTINRVPGETIIMDYGAGVGTLYLLAKMCGFKKVIYSDHLEDWKTSAQLIAEAIGITIDHYIVGDIDDCLTELEKNGLTCDIIASRNVIEHIYKLNVFYKSIRERQPQAIIYSSTTANKNNAASVVKHILWHKKWEKVFAGKRQVVIERRAPGLPHAKMAVLVKATRGLAAADLENAIESYLKSGVLPDPAIYNTNTCDPSNGVWAENLLRTDDYRKVINETFFDVKFEAGYWDTHYEKGYMNFLGKSLNKLIANGGKLAMKLAPFIYVIAKPKR